MTNSQPFEVSLAAGFSNPQPAIPLHLRDESRFLLGHFRRELGYFSRVTLEQLRLWCEKYKTSDQACAFYSPDRGVSLEGIITSKEKTYTDFCTQLQLFLNVGIEDALPRCIELMSNKFAATYLCTKGQYGASEWLQWANAKLSQDVCVAQVNQASNNYAALFGGVYPGFVPAQFNTGMNIAPLRQRGRNTTNEPQVSDFPGVMTDFQPGPANPSVMQSGQISGQSVRFAQQTQISSDASQNPIWSENRPADMACASPAQAIFGDQGAARQMLDCPPSTFHVAPNQSATQTVMPSNSSELPRTRLYTSSSDRAGTNNLVIEAPQPCSINMESPNHATTPSCDTLLSNQRISSRSQASNTFPLALPKTHVRSMAPGSNAQPIMQQYRGNTPDARRAGQPPIRPTGPVQTTSARPTPSCLQINGTEPKAREPKAQRQNGKRKRRMSATSPAEPSKKPRTTPSPSGTGHVTAAASSSIQCGAALDRTGQGATRHHQESLPQVLGVKHDSPIPCQGSDHSVSTGDQNLLDMPSVSALEPSIQSDTAGCQPEIIDLTLTPDDPDDTTTSHLTSPMPSDAAEIEGDRLYTDEELFGPEPSTPSNGTDAQDLHVCDVASRKSVQQSSNQALSGNVGETGMTATEQPKVEPTSHKPSASFQHEDVPDGDMESQIRWYLAHDE
nr:hypothetical protein CFP56_12988 [Quercus suber]